MSTRAADPAELVEAARTIWERPHERGPIDGVPNGSSVFVVSPRDRPDAGPRC